MRLLKKGTLLTRRREQTCAERKEEGPLEWHEKVESEEASWNDVIAEEEEGSTLCTPKIWLNWLYVM